MFCLHFCSTSWSIPPPTTFRTGTAHWLARTTITFSGAVTIGADVIALAEETQTITTRAATQGSLQDASKRANIGGFDVVGVGRFVAAGDLGIVATRGLSLTKGVLVAHGELNTVVASGRNTLARLGESHSGSGEEYGRGEELHFDDLMLVRNR